MRTGQRRAHAGVNIEQAIDSGKGQHAPYRPRADDQAHFALAGPGPPERTGQAAYPGRIAEGGRAQIGDQQGRALIEDREQILADLVGVGDVDLGGQRYDGRLSGPKHRTSLSGHGDHRPFITGGRAASPDPEGRRP
jgi:hypothetical protein